MPTEQPTTNEIVGRIAEDSLGSAKCHLLEPCPEESFATAHTHEGVGVSPPRDRYAS